MGRSILVSMINVMKFLRTNIVYIIIIIICLYKSLFINIINNISYLFVKKESLDIAEIKLLKEENNYLIDEVNRLSNYNMVDKYNYKLARLTYMSNYNAINFNINKGSEDQVKVGDAVINNDGVIGIVKEVSNNTSSVINLKGINNLSIDIDNNIGTLKYYNGEYFIVDDISSDISVNSEVYTSTYGSIKEKLFVGIVNNVENIDGKKIIYIKSNVDFNNINYLYVVTS